jgi:flagellar hook-associated protein 3 FlgL
MRVTHNSIAANVLANLQGNINRIGETQQRLSSGKQISKPSDSPAATVSVMALRSEVAANKQYARNADDGIGWLNTADSALQEAGTLVTRARSLVLQGMSDTTGATSRQSLGAELRQISEALRGIANTTYIDRPVFGGTTSDTAVYPDQATYRGDGGAVMRTVGANTKVAVNIDGGTIFGDPTDLVNPTTIFATLTDIATRLESGAAPTSTDLGALDATTVEIRNGLSTVGAITNQLERMRQAADDAVLNVSKTLSDVEDIDLPQTITELQLQQTAYQAALAAGARVVQPSLIDFLR